MDGVGGRARSPEGHADVRRTPPAQWVRASDIVVDPTPNPAVRLAEQPLLLALGLYFAAFTVSLLVSFRVTGGQLVYPLDDTYIAMAIAKHFAAGGVWGVTPYEFASAASNPFYVLLLAAGYAIAGPLVWLPLALAITFGVVSLHLADQMLPRSSLVRLSGLFVLVILTPLAAMAQTGMEHTLHIALTLAFAWHLSIVIEKRKMDWWLVAIAPLLAITRFEGLFFVAFGALLMALRRLVVPALLVVVAAALPVVAYCRYPKAALFASCDVFPR